MAGHFRWSLRRSRFLASRGRACGSRARRRVFFESLEPRALLTVAPPSLAGSYDVHDFQSPSGGAGPDSVIIDDRDAAPAYTEAGDLGLPWTNQGFQGDVREMISDGKSATYTFDGLAPGEIYDVAATWTEFLNREQLAPYTISGGTTGPMTVLVDQTRPPGDFAADGASWERLGTFEVDGNGALVVTLAGTPNLRSVIADAVRIDRRTDAEVVVTVGSTNVESGITRVDIGRGLVGATVTKEFTVRNVGAAHLTLDALTLSSGSPFQIVDGYAPGSTIIPGASVTFVVGLVTETVGPKSDTLTFGTDDADESPFRILLTGEVNDSVMIVDDGDPEYRDSGNVATWIQGFRGDVREAIVGGEPQSAQYVFPGLPAGRYRISATWTPYYNRATNAAFTINGGPPIHMNQRLSPSNAAATPEGTVVQDRGVSFADLDGSYDFAGGTLAVRLSDHGANGNVIFDAVRLETLKEVTTFTPLLRDGPVGMPVTSLEQVIATPPDLPAKLVTIMNNSPYMVYPIITTANSTRDPNGGQVVSLTIPPGGGGSGYSASNPPTVEIASPGNGGQQATATAVVVGGRVAAYKMTNIGSLYQTVPTVTITNHNGGSGAVAPTAHLSQNSSLYDPLNPLNQGYRAYIGEYNPATHQVEAGLRPYQQVTVQLPLVFWDGARVFFASNGSEPLTSAADPANPIQNSPVWQYLDSVPAFMPKGPNGAPPPQGTPYSATFEDPFSKKSNPNGMVLWYHDENPLPKGFSIDAPGQLTEFTIRDPLQVMYAPNMPVGERQNPVLNYDVSYVDTLSLPFLMETTDGFVKDFPDVGGAYALIGADLSYQEMQQALATFTQSKGGELNPDLGTYFGGLGYTRYTLPDSNPLLQVPGGFNVVADSALNDAESAYNPPGESKFYLLTSGGLIHRVPTNGKDNQNGVLHPGTPEANMVTDLDPAVVAQLVPGMISLNVANPPSGAAYFKTGTYITRVDPVTNTITLNNPAELSNNGNALTFVGSKWESVGSTDGQTPQVSGIDPDVGQYLNQGLLVTGPGIDKYVTIGELVPDTANPLKIIGARLVDQDGNPYVPESRQGGTYTFATGPSSYIVSTLINNWYAWADYYTAHANQVNLSNVSGTMVVPMVNQNNIPDQTSVELTLHVPQAQLDELQVGGVVRGGYIKAPDENNTSYNTYTTITGFLLDNQGVRTGVILSNPVIPPAEVGAPGTPYTFDNYSFSPPLPILRSEDAQPYTLSFTQAYLDDPAYGKAPLDFAQTVYDVMLGFSQLKLTDAKLSQSAQLLSYTIGASIGAFDPSSEVFQGNALTIERQVQLRDEIKSLMRGVSNFIKYPEFGTPQEPSPSSLWYPHPAMPILDGNNGPGALITLPGEQQAAPATFNVFNLNPYVWFVHVRLGMNGYGFSVDDDTADVGTLGSSLQIAFGGSQATAPGEAGQTLANLDYFSTGLPYGTLITTGNVNTSPFSQPFIQQGFTVIAVPTDIAARVVAADDTTIGALVSASDGSLKMGTRVSNNAADVMNPSEFPPPNTGAIILKQPDGAESPLAAGTEVTYTISSFQTLRPVVSSFATTSDGKVAITGSHFGYYVNGQLAADVRSVTFNGSPANFTVHSDTSITAEVPAGASSGKIAVRGPAGTGYSTSDFIVAGAAGESAAAAPEISAFGAIAAGAWIAWHNAANPRDVNGDGGVTPADALAVVNYLNSARPTILTSLHSEGESFVDVNGDGYATSMDALNVVNAINQAGVSAFGGEGEASSRLFREALPVAITNAAASPVPDAGQRAARSLPRTDRESPLPPPFPAAPSDVVEGRHDRESSISREGSLEELVAVIAEDVDQAWQQLFN